MQAKTVVAAMAMVCLTSLVSSLRSRHSADDRDGQRKRIGIRERAYLLVRGRRRGRTPRGYDTRGTIIVPSLSAIRRSLRLAVAFRPRDAVGIG